MTVTPRASFRVFLPRCRPGRGPIQDVMGGVTGGAPGAALRQARDRLLARLRARTDTEHVMYANRVAFCLLQGAYFLAAVPGRAAEGGAVILAGLCATGALFAWLLHGPDRSVPRQLAAMTADASYMAMLMHLGGEVMGCWYPCLLWMVLGNGLRLGRANLLRAMAVATLAFGAVAATTPFWRDNAALAVGLLLGLVLLPLYAMKLLTRLHTARRAAQAADKAKSLFLANVSHELRTPLHAIIGMGSLLEKAELPPEPADMARTIMGASRSLLELIDDVLKLSRMEVDRPPADAAEFGLPGLLLGVRSLVQAQAREKGLHVALHVGFGVPLRLRGDERHIREVLVNLAGNAVKFTEEGGVLIAVRPCRADAHGPRDDGPDPSTARLRFEVVDTGIGITPEAHGRIFDKFTQAHPGITERFGGTGLGLAICRQLADLLGGTIGVESAPGRGSTFWFEVGCEAVPLGADEPAAPGDAPGMSADASSGAPRPGTLAVLSIDAGVQPPLRAAVRSLDPDAVITECSAAVVQSQLAAASLAGRTVLADASASSAAADALRAAVRAPSAELPRLVLVGDPAPDARQRDLRWLSPAWVPSGADPAGIRAAVGLCAELRTASARSLSTVQPSPGPAPDGKEQDIRQAPPRCLTILVVDDNATNRKVVAKIVESGGHRCRLASDGEAALDALEADDIDLALMDVNMPDMSGLEVTKLHRVAALGMRHVPILGLTADASPDMAERCREAGMDGCLTKPIRASDLLRMIEGSVPAPPSRRDVPKAARPVLRVVQSPLLDERVLDGLRDIGGKEFLQDVLDGFLEDAGRLVTQIGRALEDGNAAEFRAAAHALGSAAANVGAPRISQLSLLMERMRSDEVAAHGGTRLRELVREVEDYADARPAAERRSRA